MKTHRVAVTSFVSAVVLASALAVLAQQANQSNTNPNSTTPPAATTDTNQNVDTNRNTDVNRNDANRTSSKPGLAKLDEKTSGATIRASKLIGTNIKNSSDESVGEIKDLVLDAMTGKVRYVAVRYGGFLGVGSKLFAVPFEAFRVRQTTSALGNPEYVLTLDVTEDQLKGAQGFDNDHWPDFADTRFTQELDRRYNIDRSQTNSSQADRSQTRNRQ